MLCWCRGSKVVARQPTQFDILKQMTINQERVGMECSIVLIACIGHGICVMLHCNGCIMTRIRIDPLSLRLFMNIGCWIDMHSLVFQGKQ